MALNRTAQTALNVAVVAMAAVVVGFLFSTRVGGRLFRLLVASARWVVEAGRDAVEAAFRAIADQLVHFRWMVILNAVATVVGLVCLIGGWYSFGLWFVVIATAPSILLSGAVRHAVATAVEGITVLNLGPYVAHLGYAVIALMNIPPVIVGVLLMIGWIGSAALPGAALAILMTIVGLALILWTWNFVITGQRSVRALKKVVGWTVAVIVIIFLVKVLDVGAGYASQSERSPALIRNWSARWVGFIGRTNRDTEDRLSQAQFDERVRTGVIIQDVIEIACLDSGQVKLVRAPEGKRFFRRGEAVELITDPDLAARTMYARNPVVSTANWTAAETTLKYQLVYAVAPSPLNVAKRNHFIDAYGGPVVFVPQANVAPSGKLSVKQTAAGSEAPPAVTIGYGRAAQQASVYSAELGPEDPDGWQGFTFEVQKDVVFMPINVRRGDVVYVDWDDSTTYCANCPDGRPSSKFGSYSGYVGPSGFERDDTIEKQKDGEGAMRVVQPAPSHCALWRFTSDAPKHWSVARDSLVATKDGNLLLTINRMYYSKSYGGGEAFVQDRQNDYGKLTGRLLIVRHAVDEWNF